MAASSGAPDGALKEFAYASLERYSEIRDHKETMAYAGIALFVGATASALVSNDWPPSGWGSSKDILAFLALTGVWILVLWYVRFQLRRRRWAALRVSGCDWLLASWLSGSPLPSDKHWTTEVDRKRQPSRYLRRIDFFWPMDHAVAATDPRVKVYPTALEQAWLKAEVRGTDALEHERLIHAAGWLLWLAASLQLYFRAR
jgi:hypothetical protein